jgi:RNA polymerase sigma-70 factor (ECF subfamily)
MTGSSYTVSNEPDSDPVRRIVRARYGSSFSHALQIAICNMCEGDRDLLRHSIVHDRSIDQLGRIYSIHRATAARRLGKARARIVASLRKLLMAKHAFSDEEFDGVARDVWDQLEVNLAGLLRADPDGRAPVLAPGSRRNASLRMDGNDERLCATRSCSRRLR